METKSKVWIVYDPHFSDDITILSNDVKTSRIYIDLLKEIC